MNSTPAAGSYRRTGALARIARLVVLTIATLIAVAAAAAPSAAADATTETITLRVEGMYCTGCEATVRSVLTGLDGVTHAEADNDTQTATVTYEPARVTPTQMVQAINTNTYYRASTSDGASAAGPGPAPQNSGNIGVWAVVAALTVALATSVLFARRARRGHRETPAPGAETGHMRESG